jgi:hypothetical protein
MWRKPCAKAQRLISRNAPASCLARLMIDAGVPKYIIPNEMAKQIQRTGASGLTDSELLILDMAATRGGSRRMYHPDIFPYQFNYPAHDLTSSQLTEVLNRFEQECLITGDDFVDCRGESDREVLATDKGGALWETERNPDWSRHLDCRFHGRVDHDRNRISIYGHSPQVCRAYFEAACDCGIVDYRGGRIRYAVGYRQLTSWRPAQTVHLLSAWLESWSGWPDWSRFKMKRCWWHSPDEISKFWGLPPAPMF